MPKGDPRSVHVISRFSGQTFANIRRHRRKAQRLVSPVWWPELAYPPSRRGNFCFYRRWQLTMTFA